MWPLYTSCFSLLSLCAISSMYHNLNNTTATRTLGEEYKPCHFCYFPHYVCLVGPHFLPTLSKVFYPQSSVK